MTDRHCKDKKDPRRWILQSGDYKRDLHQAGVGYFFTVRFLPGVPKLSFLRGDASFPILTPLGCFVKARLKDLEERYKGCIKIETYAIMADHLHVCLWVEKEIKQTPLQILTAMMLFAEKNAQEQFGISKLWAVPGTLYVCYSTAIYQQKKKYTLANITRWHMEIEHPEYAHPHPLTHSKLDPRYSWEGYGNERLLDSERFLPCYITHAATDRDVALFTRLAITLARDGWMLVGGFVSPRERQLLQDIQVACMPYVIHLAATRLEDQKLPAKLASSLYRQTFLRLTSAEGQEKCERPLCVWQNLWAEKLCGNWRQRIIAHFQAQSTSLPQQLENLQCFLARWQSPKPFKYRGNRPLP